MQQLKFSVKIAPEAAYIEVVTSVDEHTSNMRRLEITRREGEWFVRGERDEIHPDGQRFTNPLPLGYCRTLFNSVFSNLSWLFYWIGIGSSKGAYLVVYAAMVQELWILNDKPEITEESKHRHPLDSHALPFVPSFE